MKKDVKKLNNIEWIGFSLFFLFVPILGIGGLFYLIPLLLVSHKRLKVTIRDSKNKKKLHLTLLIMISLWGLLVVEIF